MSELEAIKKAYGEYYKLCNVDNEGYSEEAILYFYPDELDYKEYSESENNFKTTLFRPKSLQYLTHQKIN